MTTARVTGHEPGCNYPFELSFDWVSGFEYDAARSIPILSRTAALRQRSFRRSNKRPGECDDTTGEPGNTTAGQRGGAEPTTEGNG